MSKDRLRLRPGGIYHVYNRANGDLKVFPETKNCSYFLRRVLDQVSPIADILAYCLMPNHFHFLLHVKEGGELETMKEQDGKSDIEVEDYISIRFSSLFNGYAKAFNREYGRYGSVFAKPFKRKWVQSQNYLVKVIHYIHMNPVEAGLCKYPGEWSCSSFNEILGVQFDQTLTLVDQEQVLAYFEDRENFLFVHQNSPEKVGL